MTESMEFGVRELNKALVLLLICVNLVEVVKPL